MINRFFGLFVLFNALLLSGCIATRTEVKIDNRINSNRPIVRKSISYVIDRSTSNTTPNYNASPLVRDEYVYGAGVTPVSFEKSVAQFEDIFRPVATSLTNVVEASSADSDISIEVDLQNGFAPSAVSKSEIVRFLTLTVIPTQSTDNWYLHAMVKNRLGLTKEYLIKGATTNHYWLPLALFVPFSDFPYETLKELRLAQWNDLRYQMVKDGFFKSDEEIRSALIRQGKDSPKTLLEASSKDVHLETGETFLHDGKAVRVIQVWDEIEKDGKYWYMMLCEPSGTSSVSTIVVVSAHGHVTDEKLRPGTYRYLHPYTYETKAGLSLTVRLFEEVLPKSE